MKEAIITDLNGLYTDVALVSDAEFGVTPLYELPIPDLGTDLPTEAPDPVLIGYRVAVPVRPGLYRPRFDLTAWDTYTQSEREAYEIYLQGPLAEWLQEADNEDRGTKPVYTPPEQAAYWIEGLTPEEIAALHPPAEPTENEKVQLAIAELALAQAEDINALQLALAEIAALLTGGDN